MERERRQPPVRTRVEETMNDTPTPAWPVVSLEEARRILAKVPGSLAEAVRAERERR